MKITAVKTLVVNTGFRNWVFVKVETDQGLHGWGEGTLGRKTRAVVGCVDDVAHLIIGQDPRRIEHLYQVMYRQYFWRSGLVMMSAISAIEQALWDILGKSLGVPVYVLLGGLVRDKIRMYEHPGGGETGSTYRTDAPADMVERVRPCVEDGYTAVKLTVIPTTAMVDNARPVGQVVAIFEALRREFGDAIDFMLDFHGRTTPTMALQYARALAPLNLLWIEEPCPPENIEGLLQVTRSSPIPVATGERLVTRFQFREIMEKGAAAILQPDLAICGGLLEGKKIAAMAETYYIAIAPHNPLGPIATAASVHFSLTTPNALIQEAVRKDCPWRYDVVPDPVILKDGYAYPKEAPGLGVEVNEAEAAKHPFQQEIFDIRHYPDGAVADW